MHRASESHTVRSQKQTSWGFLNKWHLQICSSKNNLRLPGWLAVWEHVYLKLATSFIDIWPSRSIKKGRMQIMDYWCLLDRWFLLSGRMKMRMIKTRLQQQLDLNKGRYADPKPTEMCISSLSKSPGLANTAGSAQVFLCSHVCV